MYTKNLSSVSWENKNIGTKAANLGELIKTGISVPPGFVITSDAFDKFLKENEIDQKIRDILSQMDKENSENIYNSTSQINTLIMQAKMPEYIQQEIKDRYEELCIGQDIKQIGRVALDIIKAGRDHDPVAVRPSPLVKDLRTSSYSGQLKYALNVVGMENICEAVKKTWASLFSSRMIFYRKARKINDILLMGVIIQKMLNPEKSGVIFTADPVTNDTNKIIIDSSWGLPETIIYGNVVPDNYVIEKETGNVTRKIINNKKIMSVKDTINGGTKHETVLSDKIGVDVLEDDEIARLVDLAKRVESNYNGQPQNIEWCSERNRIFVLESKPIKSTNLEYEEVNTDYPSVLTGTSVSPGNINATAKIVLDQQDINKIEPGDVIVTKNIQPDMIPIMSKISGIITDEGCYTGFTSVISREFGIPCLINTEKATSVLKDGQQIILDGFKGNVYSNEPIKTVYTEDVQDSDREESQTYEDEITGTEILLNVSSQIEGDVIDKADGIGLFKAEHVLTSQGRRPITLSRTNPEELVNAITTAVGKLAEQTRGKQIWYRSFDAQTDEFEDYTEYETNEKNPIMGWRGVRRSLDQPELIKCEIEALRRLTEQGVNIGLVIPFVTRVDEINTIKNMITFPIKLGISVDIPATALNIDELCEHVDHVSINLSMLTQLTLGVDSENPKISRYYSEIDPSVLKLVKRVVNECKKHGVTTSITNASFDSRMLEEFIKIGVNSISIESDSFKDIRTSVLRIEKRLLLEKMRDRGKGI